MTRDAVLGSWHGLSGEFVVATVTWEEGETGQWLWTITAPKRPKGWRKGAVEAALGQDPAPPVPMSPSPTLDRPPLSGKQAGPEGVVDVQT